MHLLTLILAFPAPALAGKPAKATAEEACPTLVEQRAASYGVTATPELYGTMANACLGVVQAATDKDVSTQLGCARAAASYGDLLECGPVVTAALDAMHPMTERMRAACDHTVGLAEAYAHYQFPADQRVAEVDKCMTQMATFETLWAPSEFSTAVTCTTNAAEISVSETCWSR